MMQAGPSEISCFESPPRLWDISDAMDDEELRGPALYEALMSFKPEGMSEYAWCETAGLNRGFLNDIKKKPDASPRARSINALLSAAGKTVADLYGLAISTGRTEAEIVPRPFVAVDLPKDVPIRGTAAGANVKIKDGGQTHSIERTLVEAEPVGYARRPPALAEKREVYAIYITGESMFPRFRPGELQYVDPRRDPYIGDDVVIQLVEEGKDGADPPEVTSVLVKTLEGRTATHFIVSQYNPPLTFRIERKRVRWIHRIIPLSELLS